MTSCQPLVSFIIVTYNNADSIVSCLHSISVHTTCLYEISVIDNSPGDDTCRAVKEFQDAHPEANLSVHKSPINIGFGRACNLGAQLTAGEYLFFLNPDTMILNDAALTLIECLHRQPKCIVAGPRILDAQRRVTRTCRNLPNITRVILDATGLDGWLGKYRLTRFGHTMPKPVEQIIGAAILVRRSDFESVGGMDERFFVYFEEVDLCKRLRDSGGEIWFWPQAAVQHLAGISCEADSTRARMIFVLRDSRRKYFAKHFGTGASIAMDIINRLEAVEKLSVLCVLWLLRRSRNDRAKINGFWAVATGNASRL
jgi:N-acetylglucosaminyl-diphospho-decaprenol L-rhamnosyltransferase